MRRKRLEDKIDKSCVGRKRVKLTWLNHAQLVIYKSCDHDITIAFPLRCELHQTCRYKCSLIKNLSTHLGDWGRKPKDQWEHSSPVKKLMSFQKSCHWWKTFQPNNRGLRKKIDDWRDIDGKSSMKKPPDLLGVLRGKATPYNWGLKRPKKSSQVWDLKVKR